MTNRWLKLTPSKADVMLIDKVEHFRKSAWIVFVWYYTFVGQVSPLESLEVFLAQQRTDFHVAGLSATSPTNTS